MIATNAAIFSNDAKAGMGKYTEKASQYTSLDLEVVMAATEDLRAGREVEFKGN